MKVYEQKTENKFAFAAKNFHVYHIQQLHLLHNGI